jgi:hypothetical protein
LWAPSGIAQHDVGGADHQFDVFTAPTPVREGLADCCEVGVELGDDELGQSAAWLVVVHCRTGNEMRAMSSEAARHVVQ